MNVHHGKIGVFLLHGGSGDFKFRPFVTPPDLPAERLKALQEAFAATLKDPELLREAEKGGVEIRYVSPEQVRTALSQAFDAPDHIRERGLEDLRKAGWEGL